ncbi:MAG: monovalent cation/H+ antiporter subunit D family protein [Gammaproteobacteria bacterium]|nr:monovalent cation/H+ antiporter subunit D family protein [Gammaproteobacteria bacterium]
MSSVAGGFLGHLPAFQVVFPLIASPACLLGGRPRVSWGIAVVVSWVAFFAAAMLLAQVLDQGVIRYELGGWAPPWGIEYRIDEINAFVLLIVSAIGALAIVFARKSVEEEIPEQRQALFYTAWMLCLAGLLGITITGDAFNVFVFLEISSLSTYVLISFGRDRRALVSAFRYLIMGTVGATFFLIGVGILYLMTGTLNMIDLAQRIPEVSDTRAVAAAFAFIAVGIGLKIALFPLHAWLPGAYADAPSAVTVFLAATSTKVAVYVLLRFYFTIFGADFTFTDMHFDVYLMPLGLACILIMSVIAVYQNDIKRTLAYSSIAQIGYMVIGISMASVAGLTGGIVHLFNHALMKGALFMALGCVVLRVGTAGLSSMEGLGRRMPWTMAGFVLGALSLIGVPLTAGFISKWFLVTAALERGWWLLALIIVASSLIAFAYVWRVVEVAYFRAPRDGSVQAAAVEAPLGMLVPLWALVAASVYFGIDTSLTAGVAERAAEMLLSPVR